jgi:hypothetical protein
MPLYEVNAPDGQRFEVNAPEGATLEDAFAYVQSNLWTPLEEQAKKKRTFGEAATDIAAGLGKGVAGLAQLPGQVGELMGVFTPEERDLGLQGAGRQLETFAEQAKSPVLKAKEALRAQKINQAEGFWEEAGTAIKSTFTDPALLTSFLSEQIPNLFGTMGGGLATKAGVKVLMRNATKEAMDPVLAKAGVRGAIGTGAIMQGADIGSDTYEKVYDELINQGYDKDSAVKEALSKARIAAIEAAALTVGTSFGAGSTIERALTRGMAGAPKTGIIRGALGETLSEGVEEAGGQLASNLALQEVKPDTDIFKGVGAAAGLGALGGLAFGLPSSFVNSANANELANAKKLFDEAQAKAKESNEPQPLQLPRPASQKEQLAALPYDPNAPISSGSETFYVFPDGRVATSESSAFKERFGMNPPPATGTTEAFANPEDQAAIMKARWDEARANSPAMQQFFAHKENVTKEQKAKRKDVEAAFKDATPENGLYFAPPPPMPIEPNVSPMQTVAVFDPVEGVKFFEGVPNRTASGVNLLDANGKVIESFKDKKNVVINPTEQDIFNFETKGYEQRVKAMAKDLDAARAQVTKANNAFKEFLQARPLKGNYYSELINPRHPANKLLTKSQQKGLFVNDRPKGQDLDDLAAIAHDVGYLSDEEFFNPNDNGGVNALADKIKALYDGDIVSTPGLQQADAQYKAIYNEYEKLDDEVQRRQELLKNIPTEEQTTAEFVSPEKGVEQLAPEEEAAPIKPSTNIGEDGDIMFSKEQPSKIKEEDKRIEKELTGKSMLELSDWSIKNAPNHFAKVIANMVNKRIKEMEKRGIKLEFGIETGDTRRSGMFNAKGEVQFKFGKTGEQTSAKLTLNGAAVLENQLGYPPGTNYVTVLHELLHVATRGQLKLRSKNDPLVVELHELRNSVIDYYNQKVKEKDMTPFMERMYRREINALWDIDELVSWGLTDKNMQEFLSEIKVGEKTAFTKLVELVRQVLGIAKNYETALDRLVKTSEAILNEDIEVVAGRLESAGYSFGTLKAKPFTGTQESLFNKESQKNVTNTPKFKKWFGNSKIIDEDGSPKVMYHGTSFDISHFKPGQGNAIFVTDNPKVAENFARDAEIKAPLGVYPNIIPVYVKSEKPFDYENPNHLDKLSMYFGDDSITMEEIANGNWGVIESQEFQDIIKDLGFDGFYVYEDGAFTVPSKNLGVFNSNQIKSVFNKSPSEDVDILQSRMQADFSNVDPDYAEKIRKQFTQEKATVKEKFDNLKTNFFDRMVTGVFDEFRAIKNYSDEAYMQARLSKSIDGGLQGLLEYGQVFLDNGALNIKPGTKGLLEILAPLGSEVDQYQIWKALNRDAQVAEKYAKWKQIPAKDRKGLKEPAQPSFPADVIAGRNELTKGKLDGKSRLDVYQTALNEENALNRSVLNVAREAGIIDTEGYQNFSNDIYYIPFYKAMEDGDVQSVSSSSKLTGQYFSKALKGGEKKTNDLMENVLMNWSHILSASVKNIAAQNTIKAAEMMDVAEKAKPMDGKYPANTVKIMQEGKTAHYTLSDPDLVDAISTISYLGPKSAFLDVAKGFTNALRYGVTLSPAYKIRNLIRDSMSSVAVSDLSPNLASNIYNGLALSKKGNPTFVAALAGGGIFEMGTAHEGNQAKLIKRLIDKGVSTGTILDTPEKIKANLQKALDWYNEQGNRFENANRLALYKKLIDSGKSHLEASYAARDLMDFSMQGQFRAIKVIGSVVPFFNARLQGLYKLGRDGVAPTSRVIYNMATGKPLDINDKKKAQRFMAVSSAIMLASLLLYSAYKDDEDFQRREDWDRDNFWWFKVDGVQFRIPKPFEIGALGTIAERTLEQITDENVEGKVFGNRLNSILMDTFSLNPMPQMIKPMIDLYSNKDSFTGAPIESAGMERLSKQERATERTSGIAKALGGVSEAASKVLTFNPDAQGFSPVQMDYAIKAYLGWMGATAVSTADRAVEPFQEGTKVRPPIIDTLAMGFIKTMPETQSKYMTQFYQNNERIQSALADMRHYAEIGDSEKLQKVMEEKGDDIALAKLYDQTTKQLAQLRKQSRMIEANKAIDPADRRDEMARIKIMMSDMTKQVEEMRKSLKK